MNKTKILSLINNLLTSGKYKKEEAENVRKIILINIIFIVTIIFDILYGRLAFLRGDTLLVLILGVECLFSIGAVIFLRYSLSSNNASVILITIFLFFFLFFLFTGGPGNAGFIWSYIVPLVALFLFGNITGTIISIIYFIIVVLVVMVPGIPFVMAKYDQQIIIRFIGSFFAVITLGWFFEYARNKTQKELVKKNKQLIEISLNDPLTGLKNRRYLDEVVFDMANNFLKNKDRIKKNNNINLRDEKVCDKVIGILLLDIDLFKNVNDKYGHAAGDEALKCLSSKLQQLIRADDVIVRWGGEEFLIILKKTKPEYIVEFAQKLLNEFRNTEIIIQDNIIINLTCSIGCGAFPLFEPKYDLITFENVISISDNALYLAKKLGRDQSIYFEINSNLTTEEVLQLLQIYWKDLSFENDLFKISKIK